MSGEEKSLEPEEDQPIEGHQEEFQDQTENVSETTAEGEQISAQPEDAPQTVEELSRQLELANAKAEENWDKFVRIQAEIENLRRRTERDLQNAHKFGLENIIKALLPVIDSLELGIQAAIGDSPELVKLREGSVLTLKQFSSVLEKFNCIVLDPIGKVFDPEKHQAMSMQPTADAEPNTVVNVFQKGYLLNDRLVRPAMVVVSQPDVAPTKIDEQA